MADPAKIMERVRALGANVTLDGKKLEIVNPRKLTPDALAFIKANAKGIADFLELEAERDERAAIVEYDGGAPRAMAERFASECIEIVRSSLSEIDRSWLINRSAAFIDEVSEVLRSPERAAA